MQKAEVAKLQAYLRKMFGNTSLSVRARPQKSDSVEVYMGDEFIGLIFEDTEDEDKSYNFQMAILEFDLEEM